MSGLTIFKKICKNLNSYEYTDEYKKGKKIIERELKVNKILKKKYVNLQFISYKVLGRGYSAQEVLEEYNAFNVLNDLTLEEMQLIIDWLKGGIKK